LINDPRQMLMNPAQGTIGGWVNGLIEFGVDSVISYIFGDGKPKPEEREELYSKYKEIIAKSNLPSSDIQPPVSKIDVDGSLRGVTERIDAGITSLTEAKDLSQCSVCKVELEETISMVKDRTEIIKDANEKMLALRKLKKSGELPPDVTWDDLDRKDKLRVVNAARADRGEPPAKSLPRTGRKKDGKKRKK
jgi:hypothetical protein